MSASVEIKSYHWWLAILLAAMVHGVFLFNVQQDMSHSTINKPAVSEIVITLKQLTAPVPVVSNTPEPVRQQPVIKKRVVSKPVVQAKAPAKESKVIPKPIVNVTKPTPSVEPVKAIPVPVSKQEPVATKNDAPVAQQRKRSNSSSQVQQEAKRRYLAALSLWLNKHKKYPSIARRRQLQGELTIRFVIDRQGQLLRQTVIHPSRHASLNKAAIRMLQRAAPMPAVPLELIGANSEFEYTIPISFTLADL